MINLLRRKTPAIAMACSILFIGSDLRADRGTMTLREAFSRALVRSETVAIQEQNIRIAEAHYLQVLGTALPKLSVNATELIQDTASQSAGGTTGNTGASVGNTLTRRSRPEVAVSLTQPLFQGLREFQALRVSGAEKRQNTHLRDRAKQLLLADVTRAYYTVIELEKEMAIFQSIRSTLRKRSEETQDRLGLGKSRTSELLTTESELAANEAALARSKGSVLTARDYLGFLVGSPVTEKLVDEFPVPGRLPPLESFLSGRDRRPDIKAAQESVNLAQGTLKYQKAGRYPRLDLAANYYPYRAGYLNEIDWDLNFMLNIPLFQGGTVRGNIREADARLKQSELVQAQTIRQTDLEIRQAYHRLATVKASEAALRRAESKSSENYRVQSQEYGLGLVNNLDVLQSLRDWQQRRLDANRSHYETKLEYLNLLTATGDFPVSLGRAERDPRLESGRDPALAPMAPHLLETPQ